MLTDSQLKTLRAAVNRIIPPDDYPSGWDAGVGDYFVQLFVREPQYLPLYEAGLPAVDAEAVAVYGRPFHELRGGDAYDLLSRIERGDVQSNWSVAPREFFGALVEQTMEGYYADPGNGGNKGQVSWDMIGYKMTA